MGESPARTVKEIEEIRERIDEEIRALGETMPAADAIARRLTLAAVGAAIVVVSLWYLAHRFRVHRQDERVKRLVREAIAEMNGQPGASGLRPAAASVLGALEHRVRADGE